MSPAAQKAVENMPSQMAERKAEELLDSLGMSAIPINPISVARRLNYSVNAAVFIDPQVSGRVVVRGGVVRIDVKSTEAPTRRRFTIAHEIGHAQLHLEGIENGEIADGQSLMRTATRAPRSTKEAEADRFASALLMPARQVRAEFDQTPDFITMAHKFEVSPEAMKIRLEQLGLV